MNTSVDLMLRHFFGFGPIALTLASSLTPIPSGALVQGAPSAVRSATYYLASQSWSVAAPTVDLGTDVIYNNSCATSYFWPLGPGERLVDDGLVPGPTNPGFTGLYSSGCAASYLVSALEIEYCTDLPAIDIELRITARRGSCAPFDGLPVSAVVMLANAPGSADGTVQRWRLLVDLATGGSQAPFLLPADGDGVYDGSAFGDLDRFGVSMAFPNASGPNTGPVLAGDPWTCAIGAGTRWAPTLDNSAPGTGIFNSENIVLEDSLSAACFSLASFATGFHLRLLSDACSAPPGSAFCPGDGSGGACPCGNYSQPGSREGCAHSGSGSSGARLVASGGASVSSDNLHLSVSGLPGGGGALLFQAAAMINAGNGLPFGDGLRCIAGSAVRLGSVPTNVGGTVDWPLPGDPALSLQGAVVANQTVYYQVWYRNAAQFCTPAGFNFTNAWGLIWAP